jgi:hypothetical protein
MTGVYFDPIACACSGRDDGEDNLLGERNQE